MPKYRVPVRVDVHTVYEVEASSKEEAMNKVYDEDEDCKEVSQSESDPEIYYPNIEEIP